MENEIFSGKIIKIERKGWLRLLGERVAGMQERAALFLNTVQIRRQENNFFASLNCPSQLKC